ncbi:TIR-like protein FxsC [Streptomyces sp. NPDC001928]|uniref:TIR-like protein FxsC n=1 Tax=Streptomyces sp. NPDC001928 TaxID=3154404 RepID=UPI0033214FC2
MEQKRSGADSTGPYFFLSYAHTPRLDFNDAPDPDMWVHRLFRDLCEYVMYMTDSPVGVPIGFMDRETRAGEIWSHRTSEALATCRVFVPLYSPRYFISDTCGREWSAFSQRQADHSMSSPGLIVPALWAPVPAHNLPHAAQSLPYDHERFGREYATFGLYGLMKLRSFRQQYEKITFLLAQTIAATAQVNPLPVGRPLDFTQLPSAFEQRAGRRRILRIVVAAPSRQELPPGRPDQCYGSSALDWNPYRESDTDTTRPLAEIAAAMAERLDYRPTVESLDEAVGGLLTERRPDGPTLMLLDQWALSDPKRQALLARMDEAAPPWLGVIVPSNPDSDDKTGLELQTALKQTLPRTVRRVRSVPRAAMAGVPSLDEFVALLPHVIQWAVAQFLRFTPSHPPPGSATRRFRLGGPVEEASDDRRP